MELQFVLCCHKEDGRRVVTTDRDLAAAVNDCGLVVDGDLRVADQPDRSRAAAVEGDEAAAADGLAQGRFGAAALRAVADDAKGGSAAAHQPIRQAGRTPGPAANDACV